MNNRHKVLSHIIQDLAETYKTEDILKVLVENLETEALEKAIDKMNKGYGIEIAYEYFEQIP